MRLDRLARIEKLRLLYQQSFSAIFASLFTAALICTVLWQVQEKSVLLGWFFVLLFSSLARMLLFYRYWHFQPENEALLAWEKPYFLTLLASSLTWGLGAVVILPEGSVLHQVVVYFFLVGMSGGAIAMYSAHRAMTLATIASILLPMTLWFLLQGTVIATALALGALMFVAVTVGAGRVLSSTMHRSFRLGYELQDARDAAEKRASKDALTGLNNRRVFYQQGEEMLGECKEGVRQLAMIISDVDHFKSINDTWGHHCGDEVLKAIADAQLSCLRSDDLCARLGGEEFGILLLVNDGEQAREVAETLRSCLEHTNITCGNHEVPVTASFGVAVGRQSLETLFKQADAALYRAKETGRNRVVCSFDENEREAAPVLVNRRG
ncbi:GGDEF domain-containing protein [Thiolapillus sp.]